MNALHFLEMIARATVLMVDGQLLSSWEAEKPEDINSLMDITYVLKGTWQADDAQYEAHILFAALQSATCSADGEIIVMDEHQQPTRIRCYNLLPILEPTT